MLWNILKVYIFLLVKLISDASTTKNTIPALRKPIRLNSRVHSSISEQWGKPQCQASEHVLPDCLTFTTPHTSCNRWCNSWLVAEMKEYQIIHSGVNAGVESAQMTDRSTDRQTRTQVSNYSSAIHQADNFMLVWGSDVSCSKSFWS